MKVNLSFRSVFFVTVLLIPPSALCADRTDPWNTLKEVTRRTTYWFVAPNLGCVKGRIKDITALAITIKDRDAPVVAIKRVDLLRGMDGHKQSDVIYSARSSWADVAAMLSNSREWARVFTKAGKKYEGKFVKADDAAIVLMQAGHTLSLPKTDISQVFYIREEPQSDSAVYAAQEFAVIDPELWPHLLHIEGHLSVRLYDFSLPEDNVHIGCGK
jgi:hypothetical protein